MPRAEQLLRVVQKGDNGATIVLEVDVLMQHGHVFEIRGQTEPGARVMVNGQEVPWLVLKANSATLPTLCRRAKT